MFSLLSINVVAHGIKFEYDDFNPEYKRFNSNFEKLEYGHKYFKNYGEKHSKRCFYGEKWYASMNYKRYYRNNCNDYTRYQSYTPKKYQRYDIIKVVYI